MSLFSVIKPLSFSRSIKLCMHSKNAAVHSIQQSRTGAEVSHALCDARHGSHNTTQDKQALLEASWMYYVFDFELTFHCCVFRSLSPLPTFS